MSVSLPWSLSDPDVPLYDLWVVSPVMRELLVLLGAILLVLVAGIAAVLLRRRLERPRAKRHEHSRRRRPFHRTATGVARLRKMIQEQPIRRRRHHRPRNPTLAETGGLPPVRPDSSPKPPQPQTQPP